MLLIGQFDPLKEKKNDGFLGSLKITENCPVSPIFGQLAPVGSSINKRTRKHLSANLLYIAQLGLVLWHTAHAYTHTISHTHTHTHTLTLTHTHTHTHTPSNNT